MISRTTQITCFALVALFVPDLATAQTSLEANPARVEMETSAQASITVQGRDLERFRAAEVVDTRGRATRSFSARLGRVSRSGLPVQLTTADAAPGRYVLRLSDGRSWVTVAVEIEIPAPPTPPTAVGRLDPIEFGEPVVLDASGSTAGPGRSVAEARWAGNVFAGYGGEVTTLANESPSVSLPDNFRPGSYDIQLTVVDDLGVQSEPVQLELVIQDTTQPTAVVQTPSDVSDVSEFVLDASASVDPNGGAIVQYEWTLVAVDGPTNLELLVNETYETSAPTWTVRSDDGEVLISTVLTFEVSVMDWAGNRSTPTTVEVPVEATILPTAVGSLEPIEFGEPVVFDASGSTAGPGRSVAEARWAGNVFAGYGGEVTTLANESPSVSLPDDFRPGSYDIQLTVVDDLGVQSEPVQLELVIQDTTRPTAATRVETLVIMRLDARVSTDNVPGSITAYRWIRTSGTGGDWPVGTTIETEDPVLVVRGDQGDPMSPGTHTFELTVVDASGNVSTATTVTVEVPSN